MSDLWSEPVLLGVFLFWIGACLGSFANVVILRLPKGESVVRPPSHCVSCLAPVRWFDNIPVVSWLLLRGRCRACGARFSVRYMVVELTMAVLFAATYVFTGWNFTLLEYLILVFGLVTVSFIDLDHMILPDVFTLPGILIGLGGSVLNPERTFGGSVAGILMGGGFFWLVAYLYQALRKAEGLGGGDIKLLAWIGAVLGWQSVPYVILVSSLLGSAVGVVTALREKSGLKTVIPYGPFLAIAALSYVYGGKQLAFWYLRLFFPWL